MKIKEELNAMKEEYETVSKKLSTLTEDEMALVTGGAQFRWLCINTQKKIVVYMPTYIVAALAVTYTLL